MIFSKQAALKLGIGVGLIILGIIAKRVFHWSGAGIMIFHLAGGIMLVAGLVQIWMDKK